MKIFRGEMSLWKQLTDQNSLTRPGGLLDPRPTSYAIGFRLLFIGFITYFIFFNADSISANFLGWLKNPKYWFISDAPWDALPADARRHHFYAYIFLFVNVFLAFLHFFSVWHFRRRARKSAEGQWYDKPGLTKADLYGKARQNDDHHPMR
jgi:hypothetical protein